MGTCVLDQVAEPPRNCSAPSWIERRVARMAQPDEEAPDEY